MKRKDKHGHILKKGESQRVNLTYQFRYKDSKGDYHYEYAPTLDKLREKEDGIQKELNNGLDYCQGKITVLELVDRYIGIRKGSVRNNTVVGYNFVRNLLAKEDFAYRRVSSIKMSDAKQWLIKLHDDKRSYSTITSIKGVVSPAFEMALEDNAILSNPFDFKTANVVKNDSVKRVALTKVETDRLLAYLKSDKCKKRYYNEIVILLGTGLRISELYGLTLSDLDFKKNVIHVERQLERTRTDEYYIESTKTESGNRLIPMSVDVRAAFMEVINNRVSPPEEVVVNGHTGFLFLDKDSKPKVAGHLEHALKRIIDNYNKYHDEHIKCTPHVLRHTFCTNMAQAGMPVKELQYLMGHSDVYITLNTYTHSNFEAVENSFRNLGLD